MYCLPRIMCVCQVGIDIGFHVQSFLSKADMGVRMTGGNVQVMGDMVSQTPKARQEPKRKGVGTAATVTYYSTPYCTVPYRTCRFSFCLCIIAFLRFTRSPALALHLWNMTHTSHLPIS